MNEAEFSKLLKNDRYQVFLFCSACPVPINFAVHSWFVINIKGELHRWESGKFKDSPHPGKIGVLRDFLGPVTGMNRYAWKTGSRYSSRLLGQVEGDGSSLAARLTVFLEKCARKYPYRRKYHYLGPNSNTFVQWILDHFPESGLRLPFNAIGKKYKIGGTRI